MVEVYVNYWLHPLKGKDFEKRLDALLSEGVEGIVSFVPWSEVEKEVSTLSFFLRLVLKKGLRVSLILSPEVGVPYWNSGIPDDLLKVQENLAFSYKNEKIPIFFPPRAFFLPSYFSEAVKKRYLAFLSLMSDFLFDFYRKNSEFSSLLKIVLSGSYWKYYESSGIRGDFSASALSSYHKIKEEFLSQKEWSLERNFWSSHHLEEIHRLWFYHQSEEIFRYKTIQSLCKKSIHFEIQERELLAPEVILQARASEMSDTLQGEVVDVFSKFSLVIEQFSGLMFRGGSSASTLPSFIHWTSLDSFLGYTFRTLSLVQREFLILKSILLLGSQMGSQGGGILIEDEEWFSFSDHFRARVKNLSNSLRLEEFFPETLVFYLDQSSFGSDSFFRNELVHQFGYSQVKTARSFDLALKQKNLSLIFVDPTWVFTKETIENLIAWIRIGKTLVLPKTELYSREAAQILLSHSCLSKKIEIDWGVAYQVYPVQDGTLITYEVQNPFSAHKEPSLVWNHFMNSLSGFVRNSEEDPPLHRRTSRFQWLPFKTNRHEKMYFVLNENNEKIQEENLELQPFEIRSLKL